MTVPDTPVGGNLLAQQKLRLLYRSQPSEIRLCRYQRQSAQLLTVARAPKHFAPAFLIVLTMGISAYLTLGGPFSGVRIWAFGSSETASATQSFAHAASQLFGIQIEIAGMMIGAAILVITLLSRSMRRSPSFIFLGTVAGLAIVSGWAGTQWVASNGFDATPVISHTFSAPIGESILYAMTSSGNSISFGTGSIVGVLLGSFLGSLYKGHFRWEACEDPVSYAAKFQEPF